MHYAIVIGLGFLLVFEAPASAGTSLELTAAGSVEAIDGSTLTSGFSVRTRFLIGNAHGPMIQANIHGDILNPDLIGGYRFKFNSNPFFELGAGVRFNRIWGTGVALVAGLGFNLGGSWYLSLPVIYRIGFSIEYTPYIGYRF